MYMYGRVVIYNRLTHSPLTYIVPINRAVGKLYLTECISTFQIKY